MAVNIGPGLGSNSQPVTPQTANKSAQEPLITRCVSGEDQAWRDLHRDYYPAASRFLRRMGVAASEVDDACQEVFVQVFRYLARFEQRADFQTWLYKLCLSQASRIRRRQRVHQALDWLLGRAASGEQTAGGEWSDSTVVERVKLALDQMKPLHKEVFVLFEFEGIEGEEIARILRCPPATVRRRLHYARQEFEILLCAESAQDGKP